MAKGGGMGDLIKQAQQMQRRMSEVQASLKERVVEAAAGGGMVTVMANGHQEIVAVKIDKEVVDPEDVEMLEDLVQLAANQALKKAKDLSSEEMKKITGGIGMNLPGMM